MPEGERRKLDSKSKRMRFVGYSLTSKGYRLFDETNRKLYIRRDVEFNENNFGETKVMTTEPDQNGEETKQNAVTTTGDEEQEGETKKSKDMPQVARQSERTRKAPVRYGYDEYADTSAHRVHHVAYHLCEVDEPTTLQEAMSSEHAAEWKIATDSEYNSLIENKTWKLVVLPPGRVAIGCKWVFKLKHAGDGTVERFKARLVAKGYAQKYDMENKEVHLYQGQCIEKVLKKFGQTEAKPVSTPADLNVKLQKEDGVSRLVDAILYQSIVESLLYAAIATRPDIAQAVGVVSKFCASPTQGHLTAAKRILRYLKGTTYLGLSYKKCAEGNLTAYSDAD